MKIAVIGSGAAAFGVFQGLAKRSEVQIDHFDPGQTPSDKLLPDGEPASWSRSQVASIYKSVRKHGGSGIPLPKSHFGDAPKQLSVDGKPRIWISDFPGGLTHYWGGTMLPFLGADLEGWPFSAAELRPYYKHISSVVGVAGRADGLSELYGSDFITRPEITAHPYLDRLATTSHGARAGEILFSLGLNRTALETRQNSANSCVSCGECMIGCFRGSTFSTSQILNPRKSTLPRVDRINEEVWRIDPDSGIVETRNSHMGTHGPYDRIFVAAGCLGTTGIVLRSNNDQRPVNFGDSFSFNVPLISFPQRGFDEFGAHFGLANTLMVATDQTNGRCGAQAQINPTVPHFWRSAVPSFLWELANLAGYPLRRHLHWVRMYLPPVYANQYALTLNSDGRLTANYKPPENAKSEARRILKAWDRTLRKKGYRLVLPLLSTGGTSSHYAASLSDHKRFNIDTQGNCGRRAIICDSSVWPETPVQSPTFTIMANAMRLAETL